MGKHIVVDDVILGTYHLNLYNEHNLHNKVLNIHNVHNNIHNVHNNKEHNVHNNNVHKKMYIMYNEHNILHNNLLLYIPLKERALVKSK